MERGNFIDTRATLFLRERSKLAIAVVCVSLVAAVGAADYWTGFERSLLVFYLVPVALAAWLIGRGFALTICLVSVATWIAGDVAAGAKYSSPIVPLWNSLIALTSFLIVVWLVASLRRILAGLEQRVAERTEELQREIAARVGLEEEIAEVTERERQRLGHELHDSLCQHLTGTSLAAQVLSGELDAAASPLAASAEKVTTLVESAIDLTRDLARRLISLELEGEGLCGALQELAHDASSRLGVQCEWRCDQSIKWHESLTPTHLFRIAQEAVNNAAKHSRGHRVMIELERRASTLHLTVTDDGIGVAGTSAGKRAGLGMRIMAHRAALIGGTLDVRRGALRGTVVTCQLPEPIGKAAQESGDKNANADR